MLATIIIDCQRSEERGLERTAVDAEGAGATTSEEIVGLCEIVPRSQHPHPRISLSYQISIVTAASTTTVERHGDPRLKQLPVSMPALFGHGRELQSPDYCPHRPRSESTACPDQCVQHLHHHQHRRISISIVRAASASGQAPSTRSSESPDRA